MAWYFMDQVKYDKLLKNLATHAFCFVKIWMTDDDLNTAEAD